MTVVAEGTTMKVGVADEPEGPPKSPKGLRRRSLPCALGDVEEHQPGAQAWGAADVGSDTLLDSIRFAIEAQQRSPPTLGLCTSVCACECVGIRGYRCGARGVGGAGLWGCGVVGVCRRRKCPVEKSSVTRSFCG